MTQNPKQGQLIQHEDIFDFAMPLLKIEKLERELHEACNLKQYHSIGEKVNELIVNARLVRAWANHHMDASE